MEGFTMSMQCLSHFISFSGGFFKTMWWTVIVAALLLLLMVIIIVCLVIKRPKPVAGWGNSLDVFHVYFDFSPRSGPLVLRVTVQYLVSFAAVFFGCHATLPHSFFFEGALRDIQKNCCEGAYPVLEPFSFSFSAGCVLSLMSCFAEKLFRWRVVSLTSCFAKNLINLKVVSLIYSIGELNVLDCSTNVFSQLVIAVSVKKHFIIRYWVACPWFYFFEARSLRCWGFFLLVLDCDSSLQSRLRLYSELKKEELTSQ